MKCDELSSSESDERGEITSEREFAIHCEDLEILKNLVKRLHYIRENNGIFNLIHLILINILFQSCSRLSEEVEKKASLELAFLL